MYTPLSVYKGKWSELDFPKIFTDDFCHDHHETIKVNSTSTKDASVKLKHQADWEKGALKTQDELKVWFPIDSTRFLYSRARTDSIKLQFDNGLVDVSGYKINFYAALDMSKNGRDKQVKLGAKHIS